MKPLQRTSRVKEINDESNNVPVLNLPIIGSKSCLLLKILFWASLVFLTYSSLALLYHMFQFPSEFHYVSGLILNVFGTIISITFIVIYRKEARDLTRDACKALSLVDKEKLLKINYRFKVMMVLYFGYTILVTTLKAVSYITLQNSSFLFNGTQFAEMALFKNQHNDGLIATVCAWLSLILNKLSLLILNGFLLVITAYLSLVLVGLCDHVVTFFESTRFERIEALNDHFLTFVTLVNRANCLLRNLLLLWYFVALYTSCNGVLKYIILMEAMTREFLVLQLPHLFMVLINLTLLTVVAARIPLAVDRASDRLFLMSKEALSNHRAAEYLFFQTQLKSGSIGLKLGGMFLLTNKLFVSFIGLGITYAVVYLQLNPGVMRKLENFI